jgi:hypothetical protein
MTDPRVEECYFFKYKPNPFTVIANSKSKRKKFESSFLRKKNEPTANSLFNKNYYLLNISDLLEDYADDEEFNHLNDIYRGQEEEVEEFLGGGASFPLSKQTMGNPCPVLRGKIWLITTVINFFKTPAFQDV